jgi:ATP-dependent DNA helicase RecG
MEIEEHFNKGFSKKLQAVYPSTEKLLSKGISQRVMIKMMEDLLRTLKNPFLETLTENLLNTYHFIDKNEALKNIHFPIDQNTLTAAQNRLKYEELFYLQLQLLMKNLQRKQKIKGFVFQKVGAHFNNFFEHHLPFDLTEAQKKSGQRNTKRYRRWKTDEPLVARRCWLGKNHCRPFDDFDRSR